MEERKSEDINSIEPKKVKEEEEENNKSETKTKNVKVLLEQRLSKQEEPSSWLSLGNWISSASKLVSEIVQGEEEDKKEENISSLEKTDQNNSREGSSLSEVETVFETSLNKIGEGANFFSSYFNEGFKKVSTTNLQATANSIASSSIETSVSLLENVGKMALGFLTVQEEVESKTRIRPVFLESSPQSITMKQEEESFEEILNKNYFEEAKGVTYQQALDNISIEYSVKSQKLQEQFDSNNRQKLTELIQKIKLLFDDENLVETETKDIILPSIELNEAVTKKQRELSLAITKSSEKINSILSSFKKDLSAEETKVASELLQLNHSYLDKLLLAGVIELSQISAHCVELLLCVVESYITDIEKSKSESEEEILKKIEFIFGTTKLLEKELSNVSTNFIESIHSLSNEGKSFVESSKVKEDIDTKANLHLNHIYLDTTNAISNIHDCKKHLFSFCKALFIFFIDSTTK